MVLLDGTSGATDSAGTYVGTVGHGQVTPVQVQAPGYEPWSGSVDATSLMDEAIDLYPQRRIWRQLVRNGMERDFSWQRQVASYIDLYRQLL